MIFLVPKVAENLINWSKLWKNINGLKMIKSEWAKTNQSNTKKSKRDGWVWSSFACPLNTEQYLVANQILKIDVCTVNNEKAINFILI